MKPIARPLPQRATIQRLTAHLETRTRAHFATAKQEVQPTLAAFADAYGKELQRLRDAAERAGQDVSAVRVPLHWLTTSGWKMRVQVALQHAADTAAQRSLADLKTFQRQAIHDGSDEAQRLLQRALAPAQKVMRRGRPKR